MKHTEFAPAKINLGLAITGKRHDGYHLLDTLFCTLDVGDTITLQEAPLGIRLNVHGADLGAPHENLVFRAAELYLEQADITAGLEITLEKRLPIAAGLGGGSSDAAATLRGLARCFPSNLDLQHLAVSLGADVPFLLRGGLCHATGIGEVLTPLPHLDIHVVLVNPNVGISAREAYVALNNRHFGPPLTLAAILDALQRSDHPPPYRNDLEQAVLPRYPVVQSVKEVLLAAGAHGVLMSGSGSTCFGLTTDHATATAIAASIKQSHPGWWVVAAQSQAV